MPSHVILNYTGHFGKKVGKASSTGTMSSDDPDERDSFHAEDVGE